MTNVVAEAAESEKERLRAEWMQLIEAAERHYGGQIEKLENIVTLAGELADGSATPPELMKKLAEAHERNGNGKPALPSGDEAVPEAESPEPAEDDEVGHEAETPTPSPRARVARPSGLPKRGRRRAQETFERAKAWIESRTDSFPKRQIFDALGLTEGEWNTLRKRLVDDGVVTVQGQRSAQRFYPTEALQGAPARPQTKSERPQVVPESAPQAPTPEGILLGTLDRIPSATLQDLYELCEAELNEGEVKKALGDAVRHGEAAAKRVSGNIRYSRTRVTA